MKKSLAAIKQPQHLWPWWLHVLLALILLGATYGVASLAIDSGNLWEYAITVILAYLGLRELMRIRIKF